MMAENDLNGAEERKRHVENMRHCDRPRSRENKKRQREDEDYEDDRQHEPVEISTDSEKEEGPSKRDHDKPDVCDHTDRKICGTEPYGCEDNVRPGQCVHSKGGICLPPEPILRELFEEEHAKRAAAERKAVTEPPVQKGEHDEGGGQGRKGGG
jgi:hypothetical protein